MLYCERFHLLGLSVYFNFVWGRGRCACEVISVKDEQEGSDEGPQGTE